MQQLNYRTLDKCISGDAEIGGAQGHNWKVAGLNPRTNYGIVATASLYPYQHH